jgi:hypothetical protein
MTPARGLIDADLSNIGNTIASYGTFCIDAIDVQNEQCIVRALIGWDRAYCSCMHNACHAGCYIACSATRLLKAVNNYGAGEINRLEINAVVSSMKISLKEGFLPDQPPSSTYPIADYAIAMAYSSKQHSTEKVQGTQELTPGSDLDAPVVVVLQETPKRTWKSYIWDTFDKSPEEPRFLFKLDAALMTLASLGYFIKYLDQVSEC